MNRQGLYRLGVFGGLGVTASPIEDVKRCFDSRPPECVEQFDRIEKKVDELKGLLTGNKNPGVGYIVRIDRLEQRAKAFSWILGILGTAVVVGIVRWLFTAVNHFSGGT